VRAVGAALTALALLLPGLPAWALDLPQLMALLAERRSGEARFTEQRFVSGLDQTLLSSGVLRFAAPDRFERHTEQPRAESMVVQGNQVTLERGGRKRRLALDAVPEVAAMVAAVRGTLTGDAGALQQYFEPAVAGTPALWSLTLTPRDERLSATVRQLRIDGQHADLRSVELLLADGDRSLMQIAAPQGSGQIAAPQGDAKPPRTP